MVCIVDGRSRGHGNRGLHTLTLPPPKVIFPLNTEVWRVVDMSKQSTDATVFTITIPYLRYSQLSMLHHLLQT